MIKTLLCFALLVVATAAVRWPLLNVPLERDEGEYAYIAWRMGNHELPYRDWVDQKPPGVFWVYRSALGLPLPPVRSIHLAGLASSAATACALFLVIRRLTSESWALGGAGLFALLSADPHVQGQAANTEVFMLLPLVLAQWAFLYCGPQNKPRLLWMLLCGLMIGVASAFKQVAAVTWPVLALLYPFFHEEKTIGRPSALFLVLSGLGFGTVWLGVAAYFHAHKALHRLIYNVLTHNLEYINAVPWTDRLKLLAGALQSLAPTQIVTWLLAVLGVVAVLRERRFGMLRFLLAWCVASGAGVSASGYFFPHYFQQALPVLCAMVAVGARMLAERGAPAAKSLRTIGIGAVSFGLPAFFIVPFWMLSPDDAVRKIYPGNYFAEMQQIGTRLAEVTRPEDKAFVFGAEPEVLFYAKRASATRYIFLFPLYGPYADAREKQMATIEELTTNHPAALLFLPNRLFFVPGTEQLLTQWTQSQLRTNYTADLWLAADQNGAAHLYRGQGVTPPPETAGQRVLGGLFLKKSN